MDQEPNEEQEAVIADVASGRGNTVVSARAGVGKTWTIKRALHRVPLGETTILVAFSKDIQETLSIGIPPRVECKTLHALGLGACMKAFGLQYGSGFDKERGIRIAREVSGADRDPRLRDYAWSLKEVVSRCKANLARTAGAVDGILDVVSTDHPEEPRWVMRCGLCGRQEPMSVDRATAPQKAPCGHAGCGGQMDQAFDDPKPLFIQRVLECLDRSTYDLYPSDTDKDEQGNALMERGYPKSVDYDDMCFLPVAMGLKLKKFTRVFCDECLPGPTPILLGDGSSRTIQDLVESKYAGDVMAYDPATKQQRPCRVTAVHTILNQKPLVKIKARWSKKKGTNKPTNFVICTIDHSVWADGRWVPAGEVKPGMVVQVETSAQKSQLGKTTKKGREVLADEMSRKNGVGSMGSGHGTFTEKTRGGNGKGPTVPERALMAELGDGWVYQHPIRTEKARGQGYPTVYKVDLAYPACKIAVEVDGSSHKGRRALDQKKDRFLESLGWHVIRVSNRAAVQNAKEEATRILSMSHCPIDAVVESVEPVTIPSFHVYDLTVEDLHCFYANGILVHNCQDLNPLQIRLVLGSLARDGRICAIGDPRQSIYGFRGAAAGAMGLIQRELAAKELPMTTTYRCGKAIVREAQKIVPDFRAAPGQHEGEVLDFVLPARMMKEAAAGDFILSRVNAPLMGLCLAFLREGRRAHIKGRDIGKKLSQLVRRSKAETTEQLEQWVDQWAARESERLNKKGESDAMVQDTRACLVVLMEGARDPQDVLAQISRMFDDEDDLSRITLSTTHRAKGLERKRVWLLRDTYLRFNQGDEQEQNLLYVGITRAIDSLYLVRGPLAA
jgi:hypothetical protein